MLENIKVGDSVRRQVPERVIAGRRVPGYLQKGRVKAIVGYYIYVTVATPHGRLTAMTFDRLSGTHMNGPQFGKIIQRQREG